MEQILQYVWQHRLWLSEDMVTVDGRRVRVLNPGTLNRDAGPDFFNATVEIGGTTWVGNVEIHTRASDWYRHGHDHDRAYDSVVLHVVTRDDSPVCRTSGEVIPQVELAVSPRLGEHYHALVDARLDVPCGPRLASVPPLLVTEWLDALAMERLHSKVQRVTDTLDLYNGDWEETTYVMLARTLGFGVNGDALERLARRTPLQLLHKHADSLLQLEALLLGQAGFLVDADTEGDPYVQQLKQEYAFLANKFSLQPMERTAWKMFRMRPANFPYRRIALLAHYVHGGFNLLQTLLEQETIEQMEAVFAVELTGYWSRHFTFGHETTTATRALSATSIHTVIINTVVPLLYARGEAFGDDSLVDRAVGLLEALPPERNTIVTNWNAIGLSATNALTTQALLQLRRGYCESHNCIRCRIGHRILAVAAKL